MAYDEELAQIMRDEFASLAGITEKKMFGGLYFLLNGNMVAGVTKEGGMARVGKDQGARALVTMGTAPAFRTGKELNGMVAMDNELMADEARRKRLLGMALEFAQSLPPK